MLRLPDSEGEACAQLLFSIVLGRLFTPPVWQTKGRIYIEKNILLYLSCQSVGAYRIRPPVGAAGRGATATG